MLPIDEYCAKLMKENPKITPEEMLHNLHVAGYDREESIRKVKFFFEDLTADELCRIVVNEYTSPLIEKAELRRILILCGYPEDEVDNAIEQYYPRSLGFVMMLDDSGSMSTAVSMVKIDSKAFMRAARTGDQFGINKFGPTASWLYPTGSSPAPITVTESRAEISAAETAIETGITCGGDYTNIGHAIELGNELISKMKTDIQAFVLLSDGDKNTGPDPAAVLGTTPPIYIAGLGPYMSESYFQDMLAKNNKSKFYNSPNADYMMTVYNQILADASQSMLALNDLSIYRAGSDYMTKEFYISGRGNASLVDVVWSDKKFTYTSGYPKDGQINLVLIDPNNQSTDIRPTHVGEGYCIYDLRNVRPGKWKLLAQYSLKSPISSTSGVIEFGTGIKTAIDAPAFAASGAVVPLSLSVMSEGNPIRDLQVSARLGKPAMSTNEILDRYGSKQNNSDETAFAGLSALREEVLLQEGRDIFERYYDFKPFTRVEGGLYHGSIETGSGSGIYSAEFTITGVDATTGFPFTCYKTHYIISE